MLHYLLFGESHFEQFGRNTTDNTVWRKGLRDNSTSSHNRAMTDSHTFQDSHIRTTPHIILDDDGLVIYIHPIHKLILHGNIRDIFAQDVNTMITGDDCWIRTEEYLLTNSTRCIRTIDSTPFRNRSTISYRQVPQSLEILRHRTDIYPLSTVLHAPLPYGRPHFVPQIRRHKTYLLQYLKNVHDF